MRKAPQNALRVILTLLLMSLALPSSAQSVPSWQVAAGYSFMHDSNDHVSFPAGWTVDGARRVARWLSIAADVDGHAKTEPAVGSEFHLTTHAFLIGARASARLGAFTEFGQLLVGTLRTTGTVFGSTETTTRRAVQPGIGLDYPLSAHFALRGELDARFIDTGEEVRLAAGVVYGFRR